MAKSKKVTTSGKAVGVSGGTLVVLLSKSLPDTSPLKPWILLAAPTVAVVMSEGSTWLLYRFGSWWKDRTLAAELRRAREAVQKGLQTTGTSAQHKSELRKKMEEIDRIEVDNSMERIRLLSSQSIPAGGENLVNPQQ